MRPGPKGPCTQGASQRHTRAGGGNRALTLLRRWGRSEVPLRQGARAGPLAPAPGGLPSRLGRWNGPDPQRYARPRRGRSFLAAPLWGAPRRSLRTPRPPLAPGPLPLRGVAPARRARRRCAGPVRRSAPSLRCAPVAGPAPRALPPGSLARPLCAAARLRGRSLAPLRLGSGCARLRASGAALWSPLLRFALAAALRVAPPGPPRARPLRGFGGGCLRPRGPARPFGPLVSPPAPGALARRWRAARVPRGPLRLVASVRVLCRPGFSPASPPPLPPPLGAPGEREASGLGAPAPGPCGPPPVVGVLPARPSAAPPF